MRKGNRKAAFALVATLMLGPTAPCLVVAGMGQGNRTPPVSFETTVVDSNQKSALDESQTEDLWWGVIVRTFVPFWIL